MANLSAAIRQVRRTREALDEPSSDNSDQYSANYERILEETSKLAGYPAFADLKQWMIEKTKQRRQLPSPKAVRRQARKVSESHNATLPRVSLSFG